MNDDVREALSDLIEKAREDWSRLANNPEYGADAPTAIADAILAAFEIRPRGTVTDAEVGRAVVAYRDARNSFGHMNSDVHFQCMRAALEAAREETR